jgi:hypothetical protein
MVEVKVVNMVVSAMVSWRMEITVVMVVVMKNVGGITGT